MQNIFSIVSQSSKGELYQYIILQSYLSKTIDFKYRKEITKFRISNHRLNIVGRYKNIVRQQKVCTSCFTVFAGVYLYNLCVHGLNVEHLYNSLYISYFLFISFSNSSINQSISQKELNAFPEGVVNAEMEMHYILKVLQLYNAK